MAQDSTEPIRTTTIVESREDVRTGGSHDQATGQGEAVNGFDDGLNKAAGVRGGTSVFAASEPDAVTGQRESMMGTDLAAEAQSGWESGTPWSEFEDWLLQDTYSR